MDSLKKTGVAVGVAVALGGALLIGSETNLPKEHPMDALTGDTLKGVQTMRRYFVEREEYKRLNAEKLGIPESALEDDRRALDNYENYLLLKGYTDEKGGVLKDRPRSIIKTTTDALTRISWVQKAWALTFGQENFENCVSIPCTFDDEISFGTGDIALDTASNVNGQNSLRCDINAADDGCELAKDLPSAATYHSQFYTKIASGFTFGANGFKGLFRFDDSTYESLLAFCNIEDYGTIRIACAGDVMPYTDTGINLSTNTLYRLEFRMVKSATVGELDIWVNNTTEGSPTYDGLANVNTGAQQIESFIIGGYSPDAVADVWYDDVCIDTAFMGVACAPAVAGGGQGVIWFD